MAWVNWANYFPARLWFKHRSGYQHLKCHEDRALKSNYNIWPDADKTVNTGGGGGGRELRSRTSFPVLLPQLPCFWCPTHPLLLNKAQNSRVILFDVLNSLLLDRAMWCVNNEDVAARSGSVTQVGCDTLGGASGGELVSKCVFGLAEVEIQNKKEAITWWRQSTRVHTDFPKLHILISSRTQSYLDIIAMYSSAMGCLRKRPFTVSVRYSAQKSMEYFPKYINEWDIL